MLVFFSKISLGQPDEQPEIRNPSSGSGAAKSVDNPAETNLVLGECGGMMLTYAKLPSDDELDWVIAGTTIHTL